MMSVAIILGFCIFIIISSGIEFSKEIRIRSRFQFENPNLYFWNHNKLIIQSIGLVLIGGFFGGMGGWLLGLIPWIKKWESNKKMSRQRSRALPDFLDLMALGFSAGMHFDQAWETATNQCEDPSLRPILLKIQNQLTFGKSRESCIQSMASHFDDPHAKSVWFLIFQAIRHGTPLQKVLIQQSNFMRAQNFLDIEKRAQTASIRLLFPLVFVIFPAIFIILFGPLILHYRISGGFF